MAKCTECGQEFSCNPGPECWCMSLPKVLSVGSATDCKCPNCTEVEVEKSSVDRVEESSLSTERVN